MRKPLAIALPILLAATLIAVAVGCGGGDDKLSGDLPGGPDAIELKSPAFAEGALIPVLYSCDGADLSPPLEWSKPPAGTKSQALFLIDPDAGGFTHWTVFDITPKVKSTGEGQVPLNARQGKNSFGNDRYGGPCPPKGDKAHRYQFAVYALKAKPGLKEGASPNEVKDAIEPLVLARGVLSGSFGR